MQAKKTLGTRIEIIEVLTGIRHVIHTSTEPFEAPNWARDGSYLILNCKGSIYRLPLTEKNQAASEPIRVDTQFADKNNNDHGLSPDGTLLAISHHAVDRPAGANSTIYIVPVDGGMPRMITAKSPSYWHGWSPDGKFLAYTAKREGFFNIHTIPVEGGDEIRLTHNQALDDGPDYSADGKHIWYTSTATGTMQLYRMKTDGSDQTQMTHDSFQNWFPHESPDGKNVIFLSYLPEVPANSHPPYQHVMLRMMTASGGLPKVVANLFGGQGTINVPSWSPDSRHVAFVSNTSEPDFI